MEIDRMHHTYRTFLCCLIALFAAWGGAGGLARGQEVLSVRYEARDRTALDPAMIQPYISAEPGQTITRDTLARDVRALEQSGRFAFVAADLERAADGVVVVYTVEPKPRIRRLTVSGADNLGNRKVRELLELGVGDSVDDALLAERAQAVKEQYRKKHYPFADLSWTIRVDQPSGLADVAIRVEEGRLAKVKSITFTGNDSISDRTLRKAMSQKKRHIFSWLTGSGGYQPDLLAADPAALRRVYLDEGFLDVRIGTPEVTEKGEGRVVISIPITEGARYRLGDLTITGITLFEPGPVRAVVTNQYGDIASSSALQSATQNLRDYYGSRGYIDTLVTYQLQPRMETLTTTNPVVDLAMTVREGHLATIRAISFRGNTRTRDKVLRREITVFPGEIMNEVKLRNSERRLRNLGFFSSVNAVQEPTPDPSQYDAVFELEEQKTGQFMVGAGFSSIDNLIGFVELSQGNFDLFNWPPVGAGQKLRLRGTLGTSRTDIELGFTEPWFLDRRLALGVNFFRRDSRFFSDDYDQRNTGVNVSLAKPVGRFTRLTLTYGLEEISVSDVDENASDRIKQEEGDRIKSSLTAEVSFDTRDNAFIPTRGLRASVSAMGAGGPLAGDTDIYRLDARASQFVPMWFDHVFNLRGWVSVADTHSNADRVPIFDRLFVGGARTLRGFKFRDVGPKDENGEPLGGLTAWYATAEYTVPVAAQFRVAAFYDIGMVYDEAYEIDLGDYNSDIGVGIRLDIPGFPLRLDYAWPLEADEFNDRSSGRFQFSIGYSI
jgi:outer membrane protein insertion porin family